MFLVLQVKVPLVLYLSLIAWQVNSVETNRKFLQISHLLLQFSIEQLFSLIVLGNKDGDMSSFKVLFLLYVTFIVFSGKIRSISWLLCNTGKYFLKRVLILGSIGLYCVIKLHEVEKLLLRLLASSLEIFLISENCFWLCWVYSLWQLNIFGILLKYKAIPLGIFSMLFFGKQVHIISESLPAYKWWVIL